MKDNEELDISPLVVIDRTHEARYGTIKLLEGLFNNIGIVLSHRPKDTQLTARLYTQRLIIELTCQYVEDVASYSLACLETGLLYAQRVISVTSREIGNFYKEVDKLTEGDLGKIFKIPLNDGRTPGFDFLGMKDKYRQLKEFRDKYQSLYNAIKHGNRVIHMEISSKGKPGDSLVSTYVSYQWVEVNQGQKKKMKAKACDGSEIEIEVGEQKTETKILQSDTISEFLDIAEGCHQIIELILQNHATHTRDKPE